MRRFCFYSLGSVGQRAKHSASAPAELIIGNKRKGVRSNLDFLYTRNHFAGELNPKMRSRCHAGRVLSMVDTASVRAAFYYIQQFAVDGPWKVMEDMTMATIGCNDLVFKTPIYDGDLLKLEARVIYCGSASIGVYCHISRQAFDCPVPELVAESYVTSIVLDPTTMSPKPNMIPAVKLTDPEDFKRHSFYRQIRSEEKEAPYTKVNEELVTAKMVECPSNKLKKIKIRMSETITRSDQAFNVVDVNGNQVIFGGAILKMMERAALHCGKVFAKNPRVFTVGVFNMTFDSPMNFTDMAKTTCKVVCVRNSTMMIDVVVEGETDGRKHKTNTGSFLLVTLGPDFKPVNIPTGLDLSNATTRELLNYARALHTMEKRF